MKAKNVHVALIVSLALSSVPLACGDDEHSPSGSDAGSAGSGAETTGGNGGNGGEAMGGSGGRATGGSGPATGGKATGGAATGGTSGATGGEGGATGGEGGKSVGGAGGEASGGEGGEGWSDESVERLKRICKKTEALNCEDYSTCVEDFRWMFFSAPHCGPVSERMLICLDTQATIEDFVCYGKPVFMDRGIVDPCWREYLDVINLYC